MGVIKGDTRSFDCSSYGSYRVLMSAPNPLIIVTWYQGWEATIALVASCGNCSCKGKYPEVDPFSPFLNP